VKKLATRSKKIQAPDAAVLKWAGVLGHAYAIVVSTKTPPSVERSVAHETNDGERALQLARTDYADRSAIVYRQVRRGEWKEVSP